MVRGVCVILACALGIAVAGCGGAGTSEQTPPDTGAILTATEAPATTASSPAATTDASSEAVDEITALGVAWYADVDPSVCERMTDAMLKRFWKSGGKKGVRACKEAIGSATPLEAVSVEDVEVSGTKAAARIVYTAQGDRRADTFRFVHKDGQWLFADLITVTDEPEGEGA